MMVELSCDDYMYIVTVVPLNDVGVGVGVSVNVNYLQSELNLQY